ncbi:MAG: hypothetical protein K0R24_2380, partial [Gammaproteobacteria bacterium]|nr:hypothetical protein [Gammaproteobacteria bacterium]
SSRVMGNYHAWFLWELRSAMGVSLPDANLALTTQGGYLTLSPYEHTQSAYVPTTALSSLLPRQSSNKWGELLLPNG